MDDILKLAKAYSKKRHLDLFPRGNDNILEKLDYIYDENWENQGVPYPYEIFTYIVFSQFSIFFRCPHTIFIFCLFVFRSLEILLPMPTPKHFHCFRVFQSPINR